MVLSQKQLFHAKFELLFNVESFMSDEVRIDYEDG